MAQDNFDPPPDYKLPEEPPLSPGAGELVSQNEPFMQRSHALTSRMIEDLNLMLVTELLTDSKVWGTIWRADFVFPNRSTDSPFINRFMIWERDDKLVLSTHVGQRESPPLVSAQGKVR